MDDQQISRRIDAIIARSGARRRRSSQAPRRPRTGVAVLTCMDARLDVHRILALEEGDAHVIRNAGGSVTGDVILALAVSQRLLHTREILVMQHLDCAAGQLAGDELVAAVERDTGSRPAWCFEACPDPAARVRKAVRALASEPHLCHTEVVRGVLYDEQADGLTDVCHASPVGGATQAPQSSGTALTNTLHLVSCIPDS
jgi:carbonic anhydrase